MRRQPRILVFDSGLGGLTVFAEIARARPEADYVYAADDAAFPYGRIYGPALLERVRATMDWLLRRHDPDIVVIACNTASTLVLPDLRATYPAIPFVGTVPAVKPAAEQSRSRMISVLATPATVQRDYTRELVRAHAAHCDVNLVGSTRLAAMAERFMRGEGLNDDEISAELAPCFVQADERRTDHVVLACTHYPLLLEPFRRLAPWPVTFVDPAPAIARRVLNVLDERGFGAAPDEREARLGEAVFTSGQPPEPVLQAVLHGRGLETRSTEPFPFAL